MFPAHSHYPLKCASFVQHSPHHLIQIKPSRAVSYQLTALLLSSPNMSSALLLNIQQESWRHVYKTDHRPATKGVLVPQTLMDILVFEQGFCYGQIEVSTEVKLQNTSWVQIKLIAHVSIPQQDNRVTRRGFPAPQQGQILWIIIWHIIQMTVTHIPRHRDPGKHPSCLMERTPKCRRWIGEYK